MKKYHQDLSFLSSFQSKLLMAALLGMGSFIVSWSPVIFPKIGFVLANFSFLPIFLSGFALGIVGGTLSAGIFVVISGLMGGISVCVWSVFSMFLVLWMIKKSLLFREEKSSRFFYPEGRLLVSLIILFLIVLGAAVLLLKPLLLMHMPIFQGLTSPSTQEMILMSLKEYVKLDSLEEGILFQVFSLLSNYGPALLLSSWILTLFVNAIGALLILKKWGNSLRPPFYIQDIALPAWYPWLLIASALLIFIGGEVGFIGKNASALVMLGFIFQGISVFHVLMANIFEKDSSMPKIMLGFFYSLVILFPWILGILAGLGILEQFMHLRNRIIARFHEYQKSRGNQ